jgi:hypothetical protein
MQKTSRTTPVVAIDNDQTNVVRLARRSAASHDEYLFSEQIEALPVLMERASNAARQMRYFSLAARQLSLEEFTSSALRAGFVQLGGNPQQGEASFQWGGGAPDLIFSISFRDRARVSIVAEAQADIFGLILTAYSHLPTTSVEINPTLTAKELGHNALLFRDMLLTFSGFDDMPAWTKYPEGHMPDAGGLVEMWRDGVSVATVFERTWNSISARVFTAWDTLRDRL